MKHLSKKVLIIIVVIAIIATATVVFFACQPKPAATPPPKNGHTVSMAPPEDGTSPEDYDGLENLAYMAGRLSARTYFHSENTGLVDTIAKQNVVGTKDYYNGILITQSVSTSAFASVAQQKFYGDGKVVVRGPRYDKGKWNGIHTEWSNDKPVSVLDEAQYLEAYGLWADEFSDYVLNAETVSDVSDLARDENGNFVQTFTLDPAGSTYYYKRQMRTMGNLGDYPSFSSVQITFTFDDTWSVLRADIEEEYKVSVSVLNVSCKATSSIVYTYEESAVDVSAYESYFKNYADAPVTGGGETPLTVVDYLQQGFAGYLAEPSTFDLKIAVNGDTVAGRVTLDLANGLEIRASLGDLLLNVESDSLYVQYKELTGKLALSDLISLAGGGFAGVDPDKLMEQLASGSISKDGENVTIECALDLAGLHLPLTFRFLETESGVSFVDVSAALQFDPIDIGASFAPAKGADAVAKIDASKAVDLKPYVDSIFEIVNSKSFTLALGYDNADLGLSVSGELYIDALRPALRGEIFIAYAGLDIPVRFTFIDETVYLQVFEIKLKTSQEYLVEALETALRAADVTLPDLGALDLKAAISAVITADYDSIIQKLRLTDEKLSLVVDLDAFIADMNLGELSANFMPAENAFGLSVYGVTAKMQGVAAREVGAPADAESFMELSLFENFVQPVLELANAKDIAFRFAVETTVENIALTGEIVGEIKFENALEIYLQITLNGKTVEVLYRNNNVYLGFAGQKVKLAESELTALAEKLSGLFRNTEGEKDLLAFFSAEGLDLQALLESIRLTGVEENGAAILNLFVDLGILNENLSDIGAKITTDGHKLFVSAIQPVDLFGISLGKLEASVCAAENEYAYDFANSVDLKPYLDSIYKLAEEQSFEITAAYANTDLGLSVNGMIYANVKNAAVSGELTVSYAGLTIPVNFTYINKNIYLQVYNVKIQTTAEYAAYAIESALKYFNVSLPSVGGVDVTEILGAVITADYTKFIKQFTISDESLSLTVDMDALIADMNLGKLSANFMPAENAFGLSVYGVTAKMQGVTAREAGAPADADDYVSLELFEKFIEPVQNLVKSDDIAIVLEFGAKIHDVEMTVALSVEIKRIGQDMQAYLKAEIFVDGFADEVIELTYRDDYVTLVYEGKMMRVPESQLQQIAQKLGGLFAAKGETADQGLQAAILLFSEDGIDLQAFLESLCLSGRTEEGKTILGLFADLGLLDERLSETRIEISTDGQKLSAGLVGGTVVFGLPVNMLEVSLWPAADEFPYDFSGAEECGNVFEFALNAYVALFDTKYLNVSAQYDSELLQANVSGLFEFVPASDTGTELSINFDLRAEIHTFALNDAAEKIDAGSHYLNMTAVGETAYISYSLNGCNADTALYVSIPVEQLYKIGNMLLPIMGLDANAPYYDLIDHLLSAGETQFTTGIFSAIQFADLLKLLDGIPQAQGVSADGVAALSENLSLFAVGANENGDISFTLSGLSVGNGETLSLSITAQRAGEIAVDTSKTYIDISSVSLLFEDLLNAYQYTDTGYELKGSLGLSLLGIDLDLTVNIELKVGVETDGTPYLNVNLKTNGYNNILVLAIFGTQVVTNGDTETDITFKDGSIYMTRVQSTSWQKKNWISYAFLPITPEYQYRKMSLEEFAGDAMDQIFFAINLSDGAKSYISKQINSSDGGSGTTKDAGEMVRGYSFADDVHTLKLDVGAIAGDSALGELKLNITRARLEGKDYYDLVKLDGTMILVSVITMKFDLTHQSCGNAVDFTVLDENISRVNANVA